MNLTRSLLPFAALGAAAAAPAQKLLNVPIKGVLESYFFSTRLERGAVHKLTWGEFYGRPTKETKVLYSFGVFPGGHITDEAYVSYEKEALAVRAGRMRTAFGFNDWASLFYNGFNSIPMVRLVPLSDGIPLTRQDSGVEATYALGDVQIQAAAFDQGLERDQITPGNVDTATLRVQKPVGPVIVGLDALHRLRHEGGIYGVDVRYTAPRIIGRLEFFAGDGPSAANGGYADVQYRLPKLVRTQLVGRAEYLAPGNGASDLTRYTLGVRQIFCNYFQLNVNYAWGANIQNAPAFPAAGTDGWSARGMFQLRF